MHHIQAKQNNKTTNQNKGEKERKQKKRKRKRNEKTTEHKTQKKCMVLNYSNKETHVYIEY